jgi:hypothetical protein
MNRLTAAAAVLLAACSGGLGTVTGLVVEVDGDLETVRSFTVDAGGIRYEFIPVADGDYAFPLPHLREHLRSAEPVEVEYRESAGQFEALSVTDG